MKIQLLAFVVGKHSYLKNELDPVLLNLIERGILNKFFKAFKTNVMDESEFVMHKKAVTNKNKFIVSKNLRNSFFRS